MAETANFDTTEELNIVCREGDTFSMTVNLKDSNGTGLTLVTDEYVFYMQVKSITRVGDKRSGRQRENVVLQTPSIAKGRDTDVRIFESPTLDNSGNVTIEASAETMSLIAPGSYVYDLKYVKPSSTGLDTHKGVLRGSFVINSQVTDAF
tara:strand:- start:19993 stop:20442 length:450 start_codon:yes stop_codon:yes gene_type:complete